MRLKTGEGIALAAGALILGNYFFKGRALGNLIFSPGAVTGMRFDTSGSPVIDFTLQVQNTSSVGLRVDSIAGNVFSNSQLIGNVSTFTPVQIQGNAVTYVQVSARLRILGLVNDLIRAFQYKNISQAVQLQGFANVEGIQMPLNINFTVGA